MSAEIDLVVNTFERTYRQVLRPGFFSGIEAQNLRRFSRRVVLINNVEDLADARARADCLVAAGELDEYHLVADHVDRALEICGLTRGDLGRIPHYSDCALVAITLTGAPWLLYWDADVTLERPYDWVSHSIRLMQEDRRVLGASPTFWKGEVRWLSLEVRNDFALTFGLSDSVFLARRADLARPIYSTWCVASVRFPLSHIAPVFEQRLDAYMRNTGRFRANYLGAIYLHPESEGSTYPRPTTMERLRQFRNHCIFRLLGLTAIRHPKFVVNCRPSEPEQRARLQRWEREHLTAR